MGKPPNVIVDRARAPAVPFLEIAQGMDGKSKPAVTFAT